MNPKSNGTKPVEQNTLVVEEAVFRSLAAMAGQEHQALNELASELLAQAIHQRQQTDTTQDRWLELSRREQEIVALYCLGYTSDEIGERLTLSVNTIKTHLRNGMQRLRISRRSDLRRELANWDFAGWLKIEPESLPGYSQTYLPLPGLSNGRKHRV